MRTDRRGGMDGLTIFLALGGFVLVFTIGLVVLRLDRAQLFALALIVVGAVAIALILVGVAFVFRARRPEPPPVEKHIYRERVLDGRHPPRTQVVALPGGRTDPIAGLYPHLLRGAYQAGQSRARAGEPEERTEWEGRIIDVDPDEE